MKRILYVLIVVALVFDTSYSFLQFYNTPFDGDMAGGIVPADHVLPVLNNPLGLKILNSDITYANPNRFFSHWSFYKYFNYVPQFFSGFTDPISAAYLSCAIAKIVIQVGIIFLMAVYVCGFFNSRKFYFILACFLIAPFFQANGYRSYMGIIDHSTTYTFFYALPILFLLLYFVPFFLIHFHNRELKFLNFIRILWLPLGLISSLSGPLNSGIALIVCFLLFFKKIFVSEDQGFDLKGLSNRVANLPKDYFYFLVPISMFSFYSLFLGSFNSINQEFSIGLTDLYSRLPLGLFNQFFQKPGFPILFLVLILNALLIHFKFKSVEGEKILRLFKWIGFFSIIYVLLLPLGGYRDYRPNILRYDTILPLTIALIFVFAKTIIYLFNKMTDTKQKYWFSPIVLLIICVFSFADKPEFDSNDCERNALIKISNAQESIVKIDSNCTVLSWELLIKPEDSELNSELLVMWGITKEKRRYYNIE